MSNKDSKTNINDHLVDEIRSYITRTGLAVCEYDRMAGDFENCSLHDLWVQAIEIHKTAFQLGLTLDDFFENTSFSYLKNRKSAAESRAVLEHVVPIKQRELDELKQKLAEAA